MPQQYWQGINWGTAGSMSRTLEPGISLLTAAEIRVVSCMLQASLAAAPYGACLASQLQQCMQVSLLLIAMHQCEQLYMTQHSFIIVKQLPRGAWGA